MGLPRIETPEQPTLNRALADWWQAIVWNLSIDVVEPLTLHWTPEGPIVGFAGRKLKKVQLTSAGATSGSYNFTEVYETASGGWATLIGGLTGVCWEYNLNATISLASSVYAEVEYLPAAGEWRFQMGTC